MDAAIVLGSGFKYRNTPQLDDWAAARCRAVVDAIHNGEADWVGVTGSLKHDKLPGIVFYEVAMNYLALHGIRPKRIKTPSDIPGYDVDTPGDVKQVVAMCRAFGWEKVGIATERPHWKYRVKFFLEREAPDITFVHLESKEAPWWYWWKECALGWALSTFKKREKSLPYLAIGATWRLISPFFLENYVVRKFPWGKST